MIERLKFFLISFWPIFSKILPKNKFIKKIDHKVLLKTLYYLDPPIWRVELAKKKGVKVGENCRFYSLNFFSEPYLIEIGNNVIISGQVIFFTHDGGIFIFSEEAPNLLGHFGKIKIGDNCFIGMGAIIFPDVEIGKNCIVGAGSVIMDSFPDNSVISGNPAKIMYKTEMYKKMKLCSKRTIENDQYFFPKQDFMPEVMKKKLLLEKLKNIPIKKYRRYKKLTPKL